MKKPITVLAILAILAVISIGANAQNYWGLKSITRPFSGIHFVNPEGFPSLTNALRAASSGDVIYLWPGTYTIGDMSSSPSVNFEGENQYATSVTGATGMTTEPGENISFSNLTLGKFTFTDTVYLTKCLITDSLVFDSGSYYEMFDCYGDNALITAQGNSVGKIINCLFYHSTNSCWKLYETAQSTNYNSVFHSDGAYCAWYADDVSSTKTIGCKYINNGNGIGAASFRDSARVLSYGNTYINETASSQNYGLFLLTGQHCNLGGDNGSGMAVTKSEDGQAGQIILLSDLNFGKMNWYGTVQADSIQSYVDNSRLADHYVFAEQLHWIGTQQCAYGDRTILHAEDPSGDPAVILESFGKFTLQADSCSFALGDTISGKARTRFKLFAGGLDNFTTTSTTDKVVHKGIVQTDKIQLTATAACGQIYGSVSASGDTLNVTRESGSVSGMAYFWFAYRTE